MKTTSIKKLKGMVEALRKSTLEADKKSFEEHLADIDAILAEVGALEEILKQSSSNRELEDEAQALKPVAGQDLD